MDLDKVLVTWFNLHENKGAEICGDLLQEQAKVIELGLQHNSSPDQQRRDRTPLNLLQTNLAIQRNHRPKTFQFPAEPGPRDSAQCD